MFGCVSLAESIESAAHCGGVTNTHTVSLDELQREVARRLQRVVNHACIDDATAPNISVTTVVYDHHPQPGHPGFFGHFTLRPNARYNAADRSTGTKFAREQNVERQHVVAYNVQTFETLPTTAHGAKLLRVSASSLSALSEVCAEQPRIEDKHEGV